MAFDRVFYGWRNYRLLEFDRPQLCCECHKRNVRMHVVDGFSGLVAKDPTTGKQYIVPTRASSITCEACADRLGRAIEKDCRKTFRGEDETG